MMTDRETLEELKDIYHNVLFAVRMGDLTPLIQLSGARNLSLMDTYKETKETYNMILKALEDERAPGK